MHGTALNIAIVVALILVEGLFVAAEIALVSMREGQAKALAEKSRRGQAVARLLSDPNRFLASVQIGVTSTALLSSAFGAVTLSETAKKALKSHHIVGDTAAGIIGVVGVTLVISFLTLVLGELAPKRLGLQNPERTAVIFAPTLDRLARVARPVIWFLSRCTDLVVRILGGDPTAGRDAISEEELRGLVAAHESLSTDERRLIDDVFAAGEKSISEVMVSRTEVAFLDGSHSVSRALKAAMETPHSRYPVIGDGIDDVIGFIHLRDLLVGPEGLEATLDRSRRLAALVREIKVLPCSKKVLVALSEMRREGHHMAVVVDEYGGTDGIVTLEDLIEEVIGDIRDEYDDTEDQSTTLTDGVVEIDGRANLDDFAEHAGFELPDGPYETVGGYVMAQLGKLPQVSDRIEVAGHSIEVIEVDGRRAARVRVEQLPELPEVSAAGSSEPPETGGSDVTDDQLETDLGGSLRTGSS